jgi:hypothetical protein
MKVQETHHYEVNHIPCFRGITAHIMQMVTRPFRIRGVMILSLLKASRSTRYDTLP